MISVKVRVNLRVRVKVKDKVRVRVTELFIVATFEGQAVFVQSHQGTI